jgi:hypothetical protein
MLYSATSLTLAQVCKVCSDNLINVVLVPCFCTQNQELPPVPNHEIATRAHIPPAMRDSVLLLLSAPSSHESHPMSRR